MNIAIVLTEQGIVPSRTDARKMIEEGIIRVDGRLVKDVFYELSPGNHQVEIGSTRNTYVLVPEPPK